jgi:hypothetical protein
VACDLALQSKSSLLLLCCLFELSHLYSLRHVIVPRRGTHQRKQIIARMTVILQITAEVLGPGE